MLHADDLRPDDRFDRLGVDSIIAVRIAAEVGRRFEVALPPRALIDFPTIEALALAVAELAPAR